MFYLLFFIQQLYFSEWLCITYIPTKAINSLKGLKNKEKVPLSKYLTGLLISEL